MEGLHGKKVLAEFGVVVFRFTKKSGTRSSAEYCAVTKKVFSQKNCTFADLFEERIFLETIVFVVYLQENVMASEWVTIGHSFTKVLSNSVTKMSSEVRVCRHRSVYCTPTKCGLSLSEPEILRVCNCRSLWCTATKCGKAARQAAAKNPSATPTVSMGVMFAAPGTAAMDSNQRAKDSNQGAVCHHRSINCTATKCGHAAAVAVKEEEQKQKRVCNCRSLSCTPDKCSKVQAAAAKPAARRSRSRSRSRSPAATRSRSKSPIY
jgi:hypothetical protein